MYSTLHARSALALAMAGLVVTMPVGAQEQAPSTVAEAFASLGDEAITPDPDAEARAKLNREQAELTARLLAEAEDRRRRDVEDYEQALRDREDVIARIAADDAAAQQAWRDEQQRREREHEAAMERWRADVAACAAGDLLRCAAPR